MYAARDGHTHVVYTLLEYNADPDMIDANGWTALQYGQSFPEIVKSLQSASRQKAGIWVMYINIFSLEEKYI